MLTFGDSVVYHDPFCRSVNGVCSVNSIKNVLSALYTGRWAGISDAAILMVWRTLRDEFPKAKWVVCKRNLSDVLMSCKRIVPDMPTEGIGALAQEMDYLIAEVKPMVVNFDDITPVTCFEIADHLGIHIGLTTRVRQLCDFNVQVHPEILKKRLTDLICQPVTGATKQTK